MTAIQATLSPVTTQAQDILSWRKKFKLITRISLVVKFIALFALMYGGMFGANGIMSLLGAMTRPAQSEAYNAAAGFNFSIGSIVILSSLFVFLLNRTVEKRAIQRLGANPGW